MTPAFTKRNAPGVQMPDAFVAHLPPPFGSASPPIVGELPTVPPLPCWAHGTL